jgi:exonuclease SbcD
MRFLHCADLHLGVENYGRIDPATGLHTRFLDFVRCLEFVVDLALEKAVDMVLFAGDIYKSPAPNPTWQREFALQLHRLQEARVPVVIVVGNHDTPSSFGRATSVDVFKALALRDTYVLRRPRTIRIETVSGPIQISGLPWPTRHHLRTAPHLKELDQEAVNRKIEQMCVAQIQELARQLDPDVPAVLASHIAAAGATYSGSERTAVIGLDPTILTGSLANPAFDYVALGHIHKFQDLNSGGSPPVVYSGSLERIDFGEEKEEKGCCLVSIDRVPGEAGEMAVRRTTSFEFISTPARTFVTVRAENRASGMDPTEAIIKAISRTDIEDAVVRVIFDAADVDGPVLHMERIHQALRPAHYVAGIYPRANPDSMSRQRRATVTENMGLREALDRYIDNNPALEEDRQLLVGRALELETQLESEGQT